MDPSSLIYNHDSFIVFAESSSEGAAPFLRFEKGGLMHERVRRACSSAFSARKGQLQLIKDLSIREKVRGQENQDWSAYDGILTTFFKFHSAFDPSAKVRADGSTPSLNLDNFFETVETVSEGAAPFLKLRSDPSFLNHIMDLWACEMSSLDNRKL